jgi:hypothetical protein
MQYQEENGWIGKCCLVDESNPLTHTLGYALRGFIEAFVFTREPDFLRIAQSTANGLVTAMDQRGHIPGRLNRYWRSAADWVCMTGTAQIATCWYLLYAETQEPQYRIAARAANSYLRRIAGFDAKSALPDARGAIRGSFPISGGYCTYEYPNWAAKFVIDANLLELDHDRAEAAQHDSKGRQSANRCCQP